MFTGFSKETVLQFLFALPGILFALSLHEFSHGYAAYKCGDMTARDMGRLTLNPAKHIDPFGFIAMLVVHFGWAKPVPVNIRNLKKPKRDMALVALAGPLSNFLSGFIGAFIYMLIYKIFSHQVTDALMNYAMNGEYSAWIVGIMILENFIYLSVGLAVFNLIPIPPLDGSRILDTFLPPKALLAYHRYERYISIALMLLLVFGVGSSLISSAVQSIVGFMFNIAGKVAGL